MSKQVRNRGFSIALCAIACFAASLPAAARISTITADPDPASCLGPVVVQATGWWPDGCWEIDQIDFEFVADVYAVDLWLFTVHATDKRFRYRLVRMNPILIAARGPGLTHSRA